jgi:hypothetical protein
VIMAIIRCKIRNRNLRGRRYVFYSTSHIAHELVLSEFNPFTVTILLDCVA